VSFLDLALNELGLASMPGISPLWRIRSSGLAAYLRREGSAMSCGHLAKNHKYILIGKYIRLGAAVYWGCCRGRRLMSLSQSTEDTVYAAQGVPELGQNGLRTRRGGGCQGDLPPGTLVISTVFAA